MKGFVSFPVGWAHSLTPGHDHRWEASLAYCALHHGSLRDTAAGRALYKLYGGPDAGRQKGEVHHQRNKEMHERKLASGWTPTPAGGEFGI